MNFSMRHDKIEIGLEQLEVAIALYIDGNKLASAVTLAGAAEEVLAGVAEAANRLTRPLDKLIEYYFKYTKIKDRRVHRKRILFVKNKVKHHDQDDYPFIIADLDVESARLITRAISAYRSLERTEIQAFKDFEGVYLSRLFK